MTDIFLSYSSKDREWVRPLRDALVAAGYSVFWDQETPAGVNWNRWIMDRLGEARLVIVAWSKASVASDPVIHEASIAREDGKLVPCMLDSLSARDLPMGFYTSQAAALHDWAGEATHKGFRDLMQAVHARLNAGRSVAPAQETSPQPEPDQKATIADLRRRANAGEAGAQMDLGSHYLAGEGVLQNDPEAVRLFKLAADQGNARSQALLGIAYHLGRGVAKDDAEAVRLWKLAAVQGVSLAQNSLGSMYERGRGVAQDGAEAVRLYRLAADQGYAQAQVNLGSMCARGRGVAQDDAEAVRLFKLAADQGDAGGYTELGVMYEGGRGVVQDDAEAARLYKLAADQGYAHAQANLGSMYDRGRGVARDDAEAVRLWKLAASRGNEYAQTKLRWLEEARAYKQAADQGDAGAQRCLAELYAQGCVVAPDDAEVVRLYRLAADQGDLLALVNLGTMYHRGDGVTQDKAEAVRLWKLAAVDEHGRALMQALGIVWQ